jgi:hypothetical protein
LGWVPKTQPGFPLPKMQSIDLPTMVRLVLDARLVLDTGLVFDERLVLYVNSIDRISKLKNRKRNITNLSFSAFSASLFTTRLLSQLLQLSRQSLEAELLRFFYRQALDLMLPIDDSLLSFCRRLICDILATTVRTLGLHGGWKVVWGGGVSSKCKGRVDVKSSYRLEPR